ncbi:MAG: HNH endonuclease [Acidobacteria bacterium]|nr:HNH endonuclease [Acidobacteriota bacterium]
MPKAAKRPCTSTGCPELTNGGRCLTHRRAYEAQRGTTAERGYGGHHRRWRLLVLHRDPICKSCGLAPSAEADHIKPLRDGGDWSLENGQGLCKPCHTRKTNRESRKGGVSVIPTATYA